MTEREEPDEVGSVADEAAKLLDALQDWARAGGAQQASAAASAASGIADGLRNLDEHLATGGESCRYCPLCRLIDTVRGVSPEVRAHLGTAATSLLQAAAGLLATQVPQEHSTGADAGLQKIDLADPPEPPDQHGQREGSGQPQRPEEPDGAGDA